MGNKQSLYHELSIDPEGIELTTNKEKMAAFEKKVPDSIRKQYDPYEGIDEMTGTCLRPEAIMNKYPRRYGMIVWVARKEGPFLAKDFHCIYSMGKKQPPARIGYEDWTWYGWF